MTISNTVIKTAIVGFGFSAKTFHIPFIDQLDEFKLTAISSRQGNNIKKQWPEVSRFDSAQSMIEQTDAELIIITAPNNVHYSLAKLALMNNKHVLMEKPFVTQVSQGEELIALARQNSLMLSVYQNRRWDGDFLTVKKLINENRLGNIRYFESHFDRFRPVVRQRWRETATEGGGIIYDLGPHLIDQALQLFGKPKTINAHCRILREGSNTTDLFHLLLHYEDKTVALHANLFCATPNQRFLVQGDQGNYIKYGLDPQEDRLRAGIQPSSDNWGDEKESQYGLLYNEKGSEPVPTESGGYHRFYQQLANAITHGEKPPVTAEEALWTIKLIELAVASNVSGQTLEVE